MQSLHKEVSSVKSYDSAREFAYKPSGGDISDTCTTNQQLAIRHCEGPCMVLAGPGSGKTFVITRRIKHMIEKDGIDPSRILVITFSKASAIEMRDRFLQLCNEEYYPVTFGTFHAIYYQIIKRAYQLDGNHILKEKEKRSILKEILVDLPREYLIDDDFVDSVLREISVVKNEGIPIKSYEAHCMQADLFRKIYVTYRNQMGRIRKIDFDDMVLLCYELFKKRPDILKEWQEIYSYILIDEFQDINRMQYEVVKMLAGEKKNLFVVGDDDQSIYGFRGAKPEIMLHFNKEFPMAKEILLDQNFRSDQEIVESALTVINQNKNRFYKEIKAAKEKKLDAVQIISCENEEEQLDRICKMLLKEKEEKRLHENAVLFRMNQLADQMAEKLTQYQIPFICKEMGQTIYQHFIAKDLLAYYRLANGEKNRGLFFSIMNKPVRYIRREDVEENLDNTEILNRTRNRGYVYEAVLKLQYDLKRLSKLEPYPAMIYIRKIAGYDAYLKQYAREQGKNPVDYIKIAEEISERAKGFETLEDWLLHIEAFETECHRAKSEIAEDAVSLMTMHSSKGLEWKTVYIPFANEGMIPSPKAMTDAEVEEERRLFYVAMTRAKDKLVILLDYGNKENPHVPSRFVSPIVQRLSKMSMNFSTNC